jgi:ribonuclease PH
MNHPNRNAGRSFDQLREIKISYNSFGYAPGSVLFELGNTKVLCSVSMAPGVPPFLKGTKTGWLTADYAMLPNSGTTRSSRESSQAKRNERSIEISRLIGRSLRAIVDLSTLNERTIHVDCDVLQADGSTRTAAITGSCIALQMAVETWLASGQLTTNILTDTIVAVSVGIKDNKPFMDLDFNEDNTIDADYNFVLTKSNAIIEIQGTAEKSPLSWSQFEQMKELAIQGSSTLFSLIDLSFASRDCVQKNPNTVTLKSDRSSLFSLKNRFVNVG